MELFPKFIFGYDGCLNTYKPLKFPEPLEFLKPMVPETKEFLNYERYYKNGYLQFINKYDYDFKTKQTVLAVCDTYKIDSQEPNRYTISRKIFNNSGEIIEEEEYSS
jgi:hypothetical protein